MATAKPLSIAPRRRGYRKVLVLLALIGAALLAVFWSNLRSYAVAASSVGARVACSCRYLGGRELPDCRKDFEPGMGLVLLSEDAAATSVTASIPLLSSETATYRDGAGCMLEEWSH